jgi:hypothetical protein
MGEIEDEKLTQDEINGLMVLMGAIVRQICLLPLEKYIDQANHALNVAPFVDPTLWMKAHKSAEEWLTIAKSLNRIKQKHKGSVLNGK